ncbi:MAG: peptidylprolyl isomerase, partial [Candidatus Omnitrophota bacterium]
KVDISYILIDKDLYLDKISVQPEETREFYEENKDMFFSPAKVGIEYLRIPYEEAEDKDAAVEQSRKIYAELTRSPEKFGEIAEKNKLDYGKTKPFSREELIPGIKSGENLHNIAFSLKEGEVSPPVLSGPKKGSIYIIRKTEYIAPELLEFEKVEEGIISALSSVKCIRLADEKANDIYGRIAGREMTLEKAGKLNGQLVKTETGIKADGYIQNIGPAGPIVTRALKSGEGEVVSPIIIKEKGALLVRVDKIIPADEAGFEEKKDELRRNFLARKQIEAVEKWMEKNSSRIKLRRSLSDL